MAPDSKFWSLVGNQVLEGQNQCVFGIVYYLRSGSLSPKTWNVEPQPQNLKLTYVVFPGTHLISKKPPNTPNPRKFPSISFKNVLVSERLNTECRANIAGCGRFPQ